jgi:hypothetical protein
MLLMTIITIHHHDDDCVSEGIFCLMMWNWNFIMERIKEFIGCGGLLSHGSKVLSLTLLKFFSVIQKFKNYTHEIYTSNLEFTSKFNGSKKFKKVKSSVL